VYCNSPRRRKSAQQGAPGGVEDIVVDLVDRDRAGQPGQLEAVAVSVDLWLVARRPRAARRDRLRYASRCVCPRKTVC
jgi:hypothetical protein